VEAISATYQHIFTVWMPGGAVKFNPAVAVFEVQSEGKTQQPVSIHVSLVPRGDDGRSAG
jgi:hypothetical protein